MIPRHIHYVWVGSALPEKQRSYVETWRATNPDYKLTQWDESNIDFSMPLIQQAYDRRQWSKVADIARLAAVLQHGGIYLDTDFALLKSLDPLLQHQCFYGFQYEFHPTDWIANGAFGAVPGHWFVKKAMDRILSMRSSRLGLERPTAFGPKLITKLLRDEGLRDHMYSPQGTHIRDIFLCPTQVFYPYQAHEEFTEACVRPDTLAAHHWEKSWDKDIPKVLRIARSARNTMRRLFNVAR